MNKREQLAAMRLEDFKEHLRVIAGPQRQRIQTGGLEAYDWLKNALASSSLFRGHFPLWRQLRPSCSVLLLP